MIVYYDSVLTLHIHVPLMCSLLLYAKPPSHEAVTITVDDRACISPKSPLTIFQEEDEAEDE